MRGVEVAAAGAGGKRATGLGRGLSSLLGEMQAIETAQSTGRGVEQITIAAIIANQRQPRRKFDGEKLEELTESIRAQGVLQPILVRPVDGGRYEIVAGERRWRAAQAAGLHQIPAVIRELDDATGFELALVENIQRADLNPIEEAEGFQRLINEFGHSQEQLGKLVHKSRSHIANLLRLLDLPQSVRVMVMEEQITMGHARALVTARDPERLAEMVIRDGLSVRQTEALARGEKEGSKPRSKAAGSTQVADADIAALERQLSDSLGLKVQIAHEGTGGRLTVTYSTLDQLDMLCQRLSGERF